MADFGGMSAADINASMYGGFSPAQGQAVLNNNFNNFGQQTDYYSALGAAYGRQTGGFNGGLPGVQSPLQQEQDPSFNERFNAIPPSTPMQLYNSGGYDPYSSQTFQPGAQQNLPYASPGSPLSANPYSVDPGIWNSMSAGDRATFNRAMGGGSNAVDFSNQPSSVVADPTRWSAQIDSPLGGSAGWQTGFPALPPQPTPIQQYNSGGFDPYSPQTFQPAVQGNTAYASPFSSISANPYNVDPGTWGRMSAADQATFNRAMGGSDSFANRFDALPPQLPDLINNGGYTLGQPNSPSFMPYLPGQSPSSFDARFNAVQPGSQSSNDSGSRDAIAMAMMQSTPYYGGG
jgi:hypothetical protein